MCVAIQRATECRGAVRGGVVKRRIVVIAVLICSCRTPLWAAEPLRYIDTISMPGVEGRIDHMALDPEGQRLFVAALGNNTVEVIDLKARKIAHSIRGLHEPQGVAFLKDLGILAVANGDDGSVRFYDASSYQPAGKLDFSPDPDNLRYDAKRKRLYVGFGSGSSGAIGVIDPASKKRLNAIKLSEHAESFQLETNGPRIFVNVPEAGHVAVVDRDQSAAIAEWPVKDASANFPMALDETNHRLYVGCRKPARLLVLDTQAGRTVKMVPVAGDTDDIFYDAAAKRIYVSGGEGIISIVAQRNADNYELEGKMTTASGARTSFFATTSRTLYVAVPRRDKQKAELRVFQAQ